MNRKNKSKSKKLLSIISENYETVNMYKFKQEAILDNSILHVIFKKKGKEKEMIIYNDFNCTDINYCPDYYILETEYKGKKEYISIAKDIKNDRDIEKIYGIKTPAFSSNCLAKSGERQGVER